jgi:hypothetical protein
MASNKRLLEVRRLYEQKNAAVAALLSELEEYVNTHPDWLLEQRWRDLYQAHENALAERAAFERAHQQELAELQSDYRASISASLFSPALIKFCGLVIILGYLLYAFFGSTVVISFALGVTGIVLIGLALFILSELLDR